jgi:hypothetical protein
MLTKKPVPNTFGLRWASTSIMYHAPKIVYDVVYTTSIRATVGGMFPAHLLDFFRISADPLSRFGNEVTKATMLHTKAITTQDTAWNPVKCVGLATLTKKAQKKQGSMLIAATGRTSGESIERCASHFSWSSSPKLCERENRKFLRASAW